MTILLLIHQCDAAVVLKHQPLKYKIYVRSQTLQGVTPLITNHKESNAKTFNLSSRGLIIGHLHIQGICGENLKTNQN